MTSEVVDGIKMVLGVNMTEGYSKYLGLQSLFPIIKHDIFQPIVRELGLVVVAWNNRLVSIRGKQVLIKAMAQAVSTHVMSLFRLPKVINDRIHALYQDLWWGYNKSKKKRH